MPRVLVLLILSAGFLFGVWAEGEPAKYVGYEVCADCHPERYEKEIEQNVHWNAINRLSAEEQKNPECMKCHSPAYGKPQVEGVDTKSVQCEGCHGPGSNYAVDDMGDDLEVDMKRGLIMPPGPNNICNTCHFPKDAKSRKRNKCPGK